MFYVKNISKILNKINSISFLKLIENHLNKEKKILRSEYSY